LVETQRNVLRSKLKTIKPGEMLIVLDFTKYYSSLNDCIIFVYTSESTYHYIGNKTENVKSDHKYVRHVFKDLYKQGIFTNITTLNIFSDGCKGQFKTRYHFYFLNVTFAITFLVQTMAIINVIKKLEHSNPNSESMKGFLILN